MYDDPRDFDLSRAESTLPFDEALTDSDLSNGVLDVEAVVELELLLAPFTSPRMFPNIF